MDGIKIYAVVKTDKVSCRTVEMKYTFYTSEESASRKALELYRMEEHPEKYDYRVEVCTLKN